MRSLFVTVPVAFIFIESKLRVRSFVYPQFNRSIRPLARVYCWSGPRGGMEPALT